MANILLLLASALFAVDALFLGDLFFKKVCIVEFDNKTEEYCYKFGLGGIFISLTFIFLGIFHILFSSILLLLYIIPILILAVRLIINFGRNLETFKVWTLQFGDFFRKNWLYLLVVSFIVFPLIPYLFLYPTSWDSLAYHLALPKLYLSIHSFNFLPWFAESAYPIGIEAIFGFGEVFKDPRIANIIVFDYIVAITLYILFGLRRRFNKNILFVAALIFLFKPILYSEVATNPNVDYPLAFYTLLVSITLLKFIGNKKIEYIALLVLLSFFCFLIKYTGLFVIVAAAISLFIFFRTTSEKIQFKKLWESLAYKDRRKYLLIIFSLLTIIPSVFWVARNTVYAGNPVYPYLRNIFPGFERELKLPSVLVTIKNENLYWLKSYNNLLLRTDNAQDFLTLFEWCSSYVAIAVLILGLFFVKNREIKYLSVFSLLFMAGILLGVGPLFRYYFPVYSVISILYSFLVFDLLKNKGWFRKILLVVLLLTLAGQADSTYIRRFSFFNDTAKLKLLGYIRNKNALASLAEQDNWDAINYVNTNLDKKKDKVLALYDNRIYYYNVPVVYGNPLVFFYKEKKNSIQEDRSFLKSQGINYIVESNNWGIPSSFDKLRYDLFVKTYCKKVFSGRSTVVYKII